MNPKIGNSEQICVAQRVQVTDGRGNGARQIYVANGKLNFVLSESNCPYLLCMNERACVNRLGFLKGLAAGTAMPLMGCRNFNAAMKRPTVAYARGCCTVISPLVKEPVSFFLVGDTHMTLNDDRGNDYLQYTERMGGKRRESVSETESFRKTLALAKESNVNLVALVGDQISFPTWAGVEFLRRELDAAGVPWLYASGNHD